MEGIWKKRGKKRRGAYTFPMLTSFDFQHRIISLDVFPESAEKNSRIEKWRENSAFIFSCAFLRLAFISAFGRSRYGRRRTVKASAAVLCKFFRAKAYLVKFSRSGAIHGGTTDRFCFLLVFCIFFFFLLSFWNLFIFFSAAACEIKPSWLFLIHWICLFFSFWRRH